MYYEGKRDLLVKLASRLMKPAEDDDVCSVAERHYHIVIVIVIVDLFDLNFRSLLALQASGSHYVVYANIPCRLCSAC